MKKSLALLLAALSVSTVAFAEAPHSLLREAFTAHDSSKQHRTPPRRSRIAHVELGPLVPAGLNRGKRKRLERALSVELFPDARLQVRLEEVQRTAIDTYLWTGRVHGDPRSSVIVAVKDDAITATFTSVDYAYEIRPVASGLHEVSEIDRAAFPDEQVPLFPLIHSPAGQLAMNAVAADAEITVDSLVAYTTPVRAGYGSQAAVETLITNAIAVANSAYANSGVNLRLNLVGTAEVAYDDQTGSFSGALQLITGTADGFMDEIHALRTALGADVVSLLVWNPIDSACGIGWIMAIPGVEFAPSAFNVTRDDCAVSNLSFPHELGHNFGLAHDRANSSGLSSRPYGFGYQQPQGLFRTIMAYSCPGGCPRVTQFSNPDVLYDGVPTGVNYLAANSADAARALNENALYISQWRPTVVPPPTFTDNPLMASQTPVKLIHVTELRSAIDALRAAKALAPMAWTTLTAPQTIRASHIVELRNALTPALAPVVPAFTDPLNVPTRIKAVHVAELRALLD
jgi:hypothetical protein